MPTRPIKASAPPPDVVRRYRPGSTGTRIPPSMTFVLVSGCLVLGLLTFIASSGLMTNILGQTRAAFGNAVGQLASQAPATAPPSGAALGAPVLDAPPNGGYTNQPLMPIGGSVPGASVGKTGYTVDIYALDKNGSRWQVASVAVGGTTRFMTPPMTLAEGSNAFVAKLSTPAGEGGPSPVVTYILDTAPPNIVISSPAPGTKVTTSSVAVSGTCDVGSTVSIRNERALGGAFSVVGSDGRFKLTVPVVGGPNTIDLSATDQAGNSSSTSLMVNRDYGQLTAHLAVTPSKFFFLWPTTLNLTLHATSVNGGPLAKATVTFTVTIQNLGPIVSPELTTDATGAVTWQAAIFGALPGNGQASVLVTSPAGDQVTDTAPITTTWL
jgi:hypothetical protein